MSQLQFFLGLVAGGLSAAALALSVVTPLESALLLKLFPWLLALPRSSGSSFRLVYGPTGCSASSAPRLFC